jgi:flagellin
MVINTNLQAQGTSTLLMQSSNKLSMSLQRLSSGSKITSPADDSAGLAVSMKLNAQLARISAASNNVGNAISFSQTQDGYISKVNDALSRMSELSVLAQDVTKTDSDRSLYQQEFKALGSYISNVATKDFNGVSLFTASNLDVTSLFQAS